MSPELKAQILVDLGPRLSVFANEQRVRSAVGLYFQRDLWEESFEFEGPEFQAVLTEFLARISAGKLWAATPEDLEAIGVPRKYRDSVPSREGGCTLANFSGARLYGAAAGVDLNSWPLERTADGWRFDPREILTAYGGTGNGKTHLMTAILRKCVEAGIPCAWRSFVRVLGEIKRSFDAKDGKSSRIIAELQEVGVLGIDEIVLEQMSAWDLKTFYEILGARFDEGRPTMCTTNNTPTAFEARDIRVHSRLMGNESIAVHLTGQDRRKPIKK